MPTFPVAELYFRLSRFPLVTHPTAVRTRCCLTLFFDCLLFRPSPIHVPIRPGDTGLHLQLSRFQRSPIPLLTEPGAAWPFSSIVLSSGGHPSEFRPFLVLLDFMFGHPVSGGHPSHYRPSPVLLDLFLRMSPLQVVAHPSADLARFPWTSSSAVSFSGGHPIHCRSNSVLLYLFLRLSPLQAVIHPCAELAWCFWTSSSAVPFSAVTHPTADRARCCFTFFFDCILFRWSPI